MILECCEESWDVDHSISPCIRYCCVITAAAVVHLTFSCSSVGCLHGIGSSHSSAFLYSLLAFVLSQHNGGIIASATACIRIDAFFVAFSTVVIYSIHD